jgi:hypothetical protein
LLTAHPTTVVKFQGPHRPAATRQIRRNTLRIHPHADAFMDRSAARLSVYVAFERPREQPRQPRRAPDRENARPHRLRPRCSDEERRARLRCLLDLSQHAAIQREPVTRQAPADLLDPVASSRTS